MCVCVCVWLGSSRSFKHVLSNNKDKFWLHNLFKILSSFLISVLVSGWNWWMNFPKLMSFDYISQKPYIKKKKINRNNFENSDNVLKCF